MVVTFYTQSHDRMANGARFNPRALTAASRVLPLRSRWELTSRSGRCVVVTITDRTARGRTNTDVTPAVMRALCGPHYEVIGVLRHVHARRVG